MPSAARAGFLMFLVLPVLAVGPAIYEGGVVNGGDFTQSLSAGAIISVFGSELAPAIRMAAGFPLPDSIDGVSVEITDGATIHKAPVFFISAGQINALLPYEITRSTLELRVRNSQGVSAPETIQVSRRSPRLLTKAMSGKGEAILTHADYTLVSEQSPAEAGEVVALYLIGMGAVEPAVASGWGAGDGSASAPLNLVRADVRVSINGQPADVVFAGLAPYWVGLYQVNFKIPETTEPGEAEIVVEVEGHVSQKFVTFWSAIRLEPLASATVPSTGGTVSVAGLALTLPSGTLPEGGQISVYRVATGLPASAGRVGDTYAIGGLPATFASPVSVSMTVPGASSVTGSAFLVVRQLGESGGEAYVKATVEGDRVTAAIPARPAASRQSTGLKALRNADEYEEAVETILLSLILGTDESEDEWFRVVQAGTGSSWDSRFALQTAFRSAWENLKAKGFTWRWPWPVELRLDMGDSLVSACGGMIVNGLWGSAPGIRVSPRLLDSRASDPKHFEAKVGHLMFHLIQSQYLSDLGIDARREWLWMDEAMALTFEEESGYRDGMRSMIAPRLAKNGLELAARSENALELIDHGFFAADFLMVLDVALKAGSPNWMSRVYNSKRGAAGEQLPAKAMQDAQINVSQRWSQYCKAKGMDLFVPPGEEASPSDYVGRSRQMEGTVNKPVVFQWSAPDLSAQLFRVVPPDNWPGNADLSVSITGASNIWVTLHVQADQPPYVSFPVIGEGTNVMLASPGAKIGKRPLYLVVSNARAVSPFDALTPITITVVMKPQADFLTGLRTANYVNAIVEARPTCFIDAQYASYLGCPVALASPNNNPGGQAGYASFAPSPWERIFTTSASGGGESFTMTFEFSETGGEIVRATIDRRWTGIMDLGGTNRSVESVTRFTLKNLPHFYPFQATPVQATHTFAANGEEARACLESYESKIIVDGVTAVRVTGFNWSSGGIRVLFDKF